MNKEECALLTFYAISPIHAGSGASVATVDLPIQRERHTGYPHIQASSVKGAMREHFRKFFMSDNNVENKPNDNMTDLEYLINFIFGSDSQDQIKDDSKKDEAIPGAISVSDAKLFAFPMRSNIAPFVWVTSPTILKRFKEDLKYLGIKEENFESLQVNEDNAISLIGDFNEEDKIILEDVFVNIKSKENNNFEYVIKKYFENLENLLLISDEMFDYCVSSCTEIQTNIKINSKTGTAEDGSLRYQEFLPSDTILYSVIYFGNQPFHDNLKAAVIKYYVKKTIKEFIQIGGDATLGKGLCKINWFEGGNK